MIHAYYALFLECRDALNRWGIAITKQQNVHSAVRLRLMYAADADLQHIGYTLDTWCKLRNDASYNLAALRQFTQVHVAQDAIHAAVSNLALLDAIESDPARRTAAIASFAP